MKRISTKRLVVNAGIALCILLSIGVGLLLTRGQTKAAPAPAVFHATAKALLRTAHPLHRANNGLLNTTGDQGDIDEPPAGAPPALCASYTTNPYANPAPNVDQIHGDTIVQVGTQKGCSAAQNETSIAVNPFNPKNLVAGTNDYRVFNTREQRNDGSGWAYTTFDGGKTWKNIELPHLVFQSGATGTLSDMDSAGDPALSFGPNNTVYYANLVFSRLNNGSGVAVSISHDGGLTWSDPSIVHTDGVDANGQPLATNIFNDKEWVAADPFDSKTAYVSWTQFISDANGNNIGSPIVVSVTHDGGATWSAPTQVTPKFTPGGITPYDQGSIPQVGLNGTLYIAYEGAVCKTLTCSDATDHDAVIVARSKDGGKTFINTEVAVDYDFPTNPHVGRSALTGENFRINSFPQFTIDRLTGSLYVTWADDRNGQYDAKGQSIKTNGDVFVAVSGDGKRWSSAIQVGSSADEVFPAVAALGGHVAVTYYTRTFDANGINLDYAYSKLNYNRVTTGVVRITTQSENPQVQFVGADALDPTQYLQGVFIGDYTAVAVGIDGKFHPCWTDFRGNPGETQPNQDSYSQAISLF